jgi:tetratricopeptide (TPR) repeat protein
MRGRALLIATSHYGQDPQLPALRSPAADAEGMRSVLADPRIGGFDVTLCLDSPCQSWRAHIVDFFSRDARDELLLLYISGHAVKDRSGKLYFAAADTRTDRLLATAIPASFIYEALSSGPRRPVLLILDTCFSGAFATGIKAAARAVNFADYFGEGASVAVLSASGAIQHALGDSATQPAQPSLFSRHIIDGLRTGKADQDGDGDVSLGDLFGYVSHEVRGDTGNQIPEKWYFGVGADLVVASNPRPRPGKLPPDISELLDDSRAEVRALAVGKLERLLRAKPVPVALAARHALRQLQGDDSRKVSDAAAAVLRRAAERRALPTVPAPSRSAGRPPARREPSAARGSSTTGVSQQSAESLVARGRLAMARQRRNHGARLLLQAFARADKPPSPEAHAWLIEAGEAWVAAGRSSRALRAFTLAHSLSSTRASADPSSVPWQRCLALGLEKMGEALIAQGNLRGARERFQGALNIREKRAEADSRDTLSQRELAASHVKVGELQTAQGDPGGALESFRAALALSEKLALADPTNPAWQNDLAIVHHRIGETLRAQGDLPESLESCQTALTFAERLVAKDLRNMTWQRELAVIHRGCAETLRLQGELDAALRSYQAALDISKQLVISDPTHTLWRRDVAVASRGKGETLTAQGDLAGGLRSYKAALAISETLASADPSNTLWQRDVARSKTLVRQIALKNKIGVLAARAERQAQGDAAASSLPAVAARDPASPRSTLSARAGSAAAPVAGGQPVSDSPASARVPAVQSAQVPAQSPMRSSQASGPAPARTDRPALGGESAAAAQGRGGALWQRVLILGVACYYAGIPWVTGFLGASTPLIAAEEVVRSLVGGSVGLFLHRVIVYCQEEPWHDRVRFWRSFLVVPLPVLIGLGVAVAVPFPTAMLGVDTCLGIAGLLCAFGVLEGRLRG